MKFFKVFVIISSLSGFSVTQSASAIPGESPRFESTINNNWTFNYFPEKSNEKGIELPDFDDSKWSAISLPHTWNTNETTGQLHPYIRNTSEIEDPYWWTGWGWYRKHFSIKQSVKGKKIFVEFERVSKYCKVWINGKYLGEHKGGYGSFDFDISSLVNEGNDNLLVVAVSNRQKDESGIPPMNSGLYNVYGGITGPVRISVKDQMFIPMQGSSEHEGGVFVTTPVISEKECVVRIQTWIKNDYPQPKVCFLNTTVKDASGKTVQVLKSRFTIDKGQLYKADQLSRPVKKPHLWSVDDPYLYTITTEISDGNIANDALSVSSGFRWFRWNHDEKVLYLNGKITTLHLADRSQEYPWLGDMVPGWLIDRELDNIKTDQGYNTIITGRYPNLKEIYDFADKKGLLIIEESPAFTNPDYSMDLRVKQVKEMIRRDRNHPSILFWCIGNEADGQADLKTILTEDTTRIVTTRKALSGAEKSSVHHSLEQLAIHKYYNLSAPQNILMTMKSTSGSGAPGRIILSASHSVIEAERSSVVLITAQVTDNQGNIIDERTKSLYWSVSGPAKLIGMKAYVPDRVNEMVSSDEKINLIPSNFIRSTGDPGRIIISCSAAGMISGSVEVSAEKKLNETPVLEEKALENFGRKAPATEPAFTVERLDDIPREVAYITSGINTGSSDVESNKQRLLELINKNNPSSDTTTTEFRALIDLLTFYVSNNNGSLSEVDFNFNAGHFNLCRLIAGYIAATKLPMVFKEGLRAYYVNEIIYKGNEKDAGEEMNWMNWIPSGGIVIVSHGNDTESWPKGVIVTDKTDLADLISIVHPVFLKYSDEAKERALLFIGKMNPYVYTETISGDRGEGSNYKVMTGKPILIPELKFIRE